MKKLMLTAAVVAMSLILTGHESWAKGPSGGSRLGTSRPSQRNQPTTRPATGRPGTPTSRTRPGTSRPSDRVSVRVRLRLGGNGLVPRTTRGGDVDGDTGNGGGSEANQTAEPETTAEEPEFGMAIRELATGTARSRGMKVGDIIMAVNGTATADFDSLQSALNASGSSADVDFINVDNGKLERITLNPVSGRIGATVEAVQVD